MFSIVVPLYKSENHLKNLIEFVSSNFKNDLDTVELILVFDGAPENIIKDNLYRHLAGYPIYKIITLKKNHGQLIATICGISRSTGQYILTMDSDMYTIKDIFDKTLSSVESDVDLIYAEAEMAGKKRLRKIGSFLHGFIIRNSSFKKISPKYNGSSFRIIKRTLLIQLMKIIRIPACLDIYLLNLAAEVRFVPVTNSTPSTSSYSSFKLASLLFNTLKGLIQMRMNRKIFNPEIYIDEQIVKGAE